ncbi:MAG TPA: hypothetical protein PLE74_04770 [Candidatus Cloacimonadota bacterium]|nr:hypothetical protein [Candidatus Cloacimonadota bacterium]
MERIECSDGLTTYVDRLPDECPFCHHSLIPNVITARENLGDLHVFMSCPNQECLESFIAYYVNRPELGGLTFEHTSIGRFVEQSFHEVVEKVSSRFVKIYNEALVAKKFHLVEIAGPGYRKALECLIKDFLISNQPEMKDTIETSLLGACIDKFVQSPQVKSSAKRAVWLGNDEVHYKRKWEDKDITDLETLIGLTVNWIEMELLTIKFATEMPE